MTSRWREMRLECSGWARAWRRPARPWGSRATVCGLMPRIQVPAVEPLGAWWGGLTNGWIPGPNPTPENGNATPRNPDREMSKPQGRFGTRGCLLCVGADKTVHMLHSL